MRKVHSYNSSNLKISFLGRSITGKIDEAFTPSLPVNRSPRTRQVRFIQVLLFPKHPSSFPPLPWDPVSLLGVKHEGWQQTQRDEVLPPLNLGPDSGVA